MKRRSQLKTRKPKPAKSKYQRKLEKRYANSVMALAFLAAKRRAK